MLQTHDTKSTPLLIYLTSRDAARGRDALSRIQASPDLAAALRHSTVEWHALDILDAASIAALVTTIERKYDGQLDILINNAGIATKGDTFNADVAETTLACNYAATRAMNRAFLPILTLPKNKGARIVNVSSMAGRLGNLAPALQARFRDPDITVAKVDALMREFADGITLDDKQHSLPPPGWPRAAYAVSKMGVTGLTRALAKEYPNSVLINAVCPGYVNTDMTSGKGHKTIDEGAMTPTFAAIGDIGNTTGEFFEDCKIVKW